MNHNEVSFDMNLSSESVNDGLGDQGLQGAADMEAMVEKAVEKRLEAVDKRMERLENQNKSLQVQSKRNENTLAAVNLNTTQILKISKDIQSQLKKKHVPLAKMLTSEGMILFMRETWENIETVFNSAAEQEVLDNLKEDLIQQGHLKCEMAEDTTSLNSGFRKERANMRQQVKLRLKADLTNKDEKLKESIKYLQKHMGAPLTTVHLEIMFHVAYVLGRYLNAKYPVSGNNEENTRRRALRDVWGTAQQRRKMADPPLTVANLEAKLKAVLASGFSYYKP